MESNTTTRVLLYTQQPFIGQGLASILMTRQDFELTACCGDLAGTLDSLKSTRPDIVLVYLTSGISLSALRELRLADTSAQIVLWGQAFAGEFVFQVMQLGVRGLLPNDSSADTLLAALQKIRNGGLCFETGLMESLLFQKRVILTGREAQLVALIAQGLKNKEIAHSLGLTEGTVKVYLTRVFKKLDMNDRLDLALYGLKNLFGGQLGHERTGENRQSQNDQSLVCPRSLPQRPRERSITPMAS
jgi:DNA-binding NarL/FixJ family response regulator